MKFSKAFGVGALLFMSAVPAVAWADAGFRDGNGLPVEELVTGKRSVITRCIDGRIAGVREEAVEAEAFFEGLLPPSQNLRVRIVNKTFGNGGENPPPFSDREYDDAQTGLSEIIRFVSGMRHRGSVFVLAPNQSNRMSYSIYDRVTQVSVETGSFDVAMVTKVFPDREEIASDSRCMGNPLPPLPPIPFPPRSSL